MSGNTIQPIEDELAQRNNDLTQEESQEICAPIKDNKKVWKFRRLLKGQLDQFQEVRSTDSMDRTPVNPRDRARLSLEWTGLFHTDDIEKTVKIVIASKITPEQAVWDETKTEALRSEIRHFDEYYDWGRYNGNDKVDDGGSDNDDSFDSDGSGRSNGSTSQNPQIDNPLRKGITGYSSKTRQDIVGKGSMR